MKAFYHSFFTLLIISLCNISTSRAAYYDVTGLIVESVAQVEDDEEAPFDIRASNKRHKCGGKNSNLFRVFSEYEIVSQRRFDMAMTAMLHTKMLSLSTNGCDGKALIVERVRISR